MNRTDEELAELSKKGDDGAFQELMQRHIRLIFNFSNQYVRNKEDAEDIAQDAFFKAWKKMKQFEKGRKFKPWLFAIARNTALDHVRKKKAVVFSDLDDEDDGVAFADTLEDTEPLQHEVFDRARSAEELLALLDILHPEHRAVMVLHYHEGMTFEEISSVMDKPMNTLKSWHRRALIKMKDHLHQSANNRRIH